MFTVVIPTLDRPSYLVRAIRSVLAQEVRGVEIIVVDDCSAESYDEILSEFETEVIYIRHASTQGVSNTRNTGLLAAKNEWVAFLDDDDEFRPGYLEYMASNIEASSYSNTFFWCGVEFVQSNINADQRRLYRTYPDVYESSFEATRDALSIGASFGFLIRRDDLIAAGMFNHSYKVAEDTELMVRLLSRGMNPVSVSFIGIVKYEDHISRLASSFEIYSDLNVYERIFMEHSHFFSSNPLQYCIMMRWALRLHIEFSNYPSAKGILWSMFKLGFFHDYLSGSVKLYKKRMVGLLVKA
ncbi:glycosyltransferase family 2 protein [Teredinibacter purpureus]|uniref:glycosyltransferase family 2 protein n=1 Tax=Teredinibacter purpureus TaxID=2731756 RepID=UPI00069678EA|nr:glycosyltransferase family 2 protein [Teredinibacter purpureus]